MGIGQKLKAVRKAKKITQIELARATGFVQPYISRGENEHFVPSVHTIEKWARALGLSVYQLLRYGEEAPDSPKLFRKHQNNSGLWGNSGPEALQLGRLRRALAKMDELERKVLYSVAYRIASRSRFK